MFDINLDQKKISSEINKKITQRRVKYFMYLLREPKNDNDFWNDF